MNRQYRADPVTGMLVEVMISISANQCVLKIPQSLLQSTNSHMARALGVQGGKHLGHQAIHALQKPFYRLRRHRPMAAYPLAKRRLIRWILWFDRPHRLQAGDSRSQAGGPDHDSCVLRPMSFGWPGRFSSGN